MAEVVKQAVVISAEAMAILLDEPAHLLKLYLAFCADMDYATAVIGSNSRRINALYVKERVEVPASAGREGFDPKPHVCRRMIDRLVKLGLIERVGKFVFFLPFELVEQSVQMRMHTRLHKTKSKQVVDSNINFNNSNERLHTRLHTPLSINQSRGNFDDFGGDDMNSIENNKKEFFKMNLDWRPSDSFSALARMSMIDIDGVDQKIYGQVLADFMLYWMGDAEADQSKKHKLVRNQHGWDRGLLMALKYAKDNPSRYNLDKGSGSGVGYPDYAKVPKRDADLKRFIDKYWSDVSFRGLDYGAVRSKLVMLADERMTVDRSSSNSNEENQNKGQRVH